MKPWSSNSCYHSRTWWLFGHWQCWKRLENQSWSLSIPLSLTQLIIKRIVDRNTDIPKRGRFDNRLSFRPIVSVFDGFSHWFRLFCVEHYVWFEGVFVDSLIWVYLFETSRTVVFWTMVHDGLKAPMDTYGLKSPSHHVGRYPSSLSSLNPRNPILECLIDDSPDILSVISSIRVVISQNLLQSMRIRGSESDGNELGE